MTASYALSPFLITLTANGFCLGVADYQRIALILARKNDWTLHSLRNVLLVLLAKNEQQQEIFLRVFTEFFDTETPEYSINKAINTNDLLKDIQVFNHTQTQSTLQNLINTATKHFVPSSNKLRENWRLKLKALLKAQTLRIGIYILLLITILTSIGLIHFWQQPPIYANPPSIVKPKPKPIETKSTIIEHPVVEDITHTPVKLAKHKQQVLLQTGLFGLLTIVYGIVLWRWRKVPKDSAPFYDKTLTRHFALEQLGEQGSAITQLDQMTLNQLADSISYFLSDSDYKNLNVPASIAATSDAGGIPTLKFHRYKQLRQVIILQDMLSDALTWNTIADELKQGLANLGIKVIAGKFYGNPTEFIDDDGKKQYLDDLDSQRQALILLIFSDGKNLQGATDTYLLEMLSTWQTCAWFELRSPAFWDEITARITNYHIPLYAANTQGLIAAFNHFLTESSSQQASIQQSRHWREPTLQGTKNLGCYLEQQLGYALPLAQACAMIQPLPLNLIHRVRQGFFAYLPFDSIEYLINIPKTTLTVTGLNFSVPVLAVLRQGFLTRFQEAEQEQILRFLLAQLEAIKPKQTDSLAYCHWSWRYHRLLLELEPDNAIKVLSQLAQTPLKNALRLDLRHSALPEFAQAAHIPLRKAPQTADGRQRLGQLAENCGIRSLEAYPIALYQKLLMISLCVITLWFSVASLKSLTQPDLITVQFITELKNFSLQLEAKQQNTWQMVKTSAYISNLQWQIQANKTYRLILSSHEYTHSKELGLVKDHLTLTINGTTTEQKTASIIQDPLKDGGLAPKMVFIQGGTFMMGSPNTEPERSNNELQHSVTVADFYLGQTEVTFADYDLFAKATQRKLPKDQGWGREQQPVINVSWQDALDYSEWLSKQTGQRYRLPTEAQWEYAARADTTTPFYTGNCINTDQANYDGTVDYNGCRAKTGVYLKKTVAVGSYSANPFGLYDMAGNVWEWTCSDYERAYSGKEQRCYSKNDAKTGRVLRGGSWNGTPNFLRSATRYDFPADTRYGGIGFRLSRM